jgi:hypothetical protein
MKKEVFFYWPHPVGSASNRDLVDHNPRAGFETKNTRSPSENQMVLFCFE